MTNEELGKLLLKGNYSQVNQGYLDYYAKGPTSANTVGGYHPGIDYRAKTPLEVSSPISGVVSSTGALGRVSIRIDGTNDYFIFLHLSKIYILKGHINAGEPIGLTGDVGASGAPHLHVEVRTGNWLAAYYFTSKGNPGVNKNPISVVSNSPILVKDLWVKQGTITANQKNGFDAQFKLVNSSSSPVTYAQVELTILNSNKTSNKTMRRFDNVTIPAKGTWATGKIVTDAPNAGTYYVVAKTAKITNQFVDLLDKSFTVTAVNNLARLGVTCPATPLNPAQTASCAATAYYSNNTNRSVTGTATTSWVTNNSNAATVSSQGVVTAKGAASNSNVSVTATYKDGAATQQGSTNVTVAGLDGKLPAAYGCTTDQKNVASKAITGGSIVLMYSSKCGTNWAMAIPTNSTLATTATVTRATGGSYSYTGKGTIYTPMVYSPSTRACSSGKIGSVSVAKNTVCR